MEDSKESVHYLHCFCHEDDNFSGPYSSRHFTSHVLRGWQKGCNSSPKRRADPEKGWRMVYQVMVWILTSASLPPVVIILVRTSTMPYKSLGGTIAFFLSYETSCRIWEFINVLSTTNFRLEYYDRAEILYFRLEYYDRRTTTIYGSDLSARDESHSEAR